MEWKFYQREKGYRDWSSHRNDKAIFNAHYSTESPLASQSGWNRRFVYSLMVYWNLPFNTQAYDSSEGLEGMELQAFLKKQLRKETPEGWAVEEPEILTSPMLSTPFDIAKWVDSGTEEGPGFDLDDPSPGDDDPDIFPEWPYDEGEYTGVETEEEMAAVRNPRIRGNRML